MKGDWELSELWE